jgi:DNA-binding NtrC family response regulator
MTPSTQVKLLRAVQELEIRPVGGNQSVKIDVRFISATNRDLKSEVAGGAFREDLYYRLAVIPMELPPLRKRREDLLQFVGHFVSEFNLRHNKKITKLSPRALQAILDLPWKGNIRELKNVIERAVLLADEQTVTLDCLGINHIDKGLRDEELNMEPVSLKKAVEETEKKAVKRALALANGNRSQAAMILGIGRRTLYDKIAYYQMDD